METVKPQFLYRGIIVNMDSLKRPLFGVDMIPPNPPKYDEQERKTVGQ